MSEPPKAVPVKRKRGRPRKTQGIAAARLPEPPPLSLDAVENAIALMVTELTAARAVVAGLEAKLSRIRQLLGEGQGRDSQIPRLRPGEGPEPQIAHAL